MEQYSEFVDIVRHSISAGVDDPFKAAIEAAINTGVLSDYLERKATEVRNMILTEYDYDTDIAVQKEDAYEEGAVQTRIETAKNLLKMGLTLKQVAQGTGLPLEEVEKLAKELKD